MTIVRQAKRFRTNPVELVIFAAVTGIFFNSVYNLFYERQSFNAAALTRPIDRKTSTLAKATTNPSNGMPTGRSIASVPAAITTPPGIISVDLRCEMSESQETSAHRLRLTGPLCGSATQARITNGTNHYVASVFADTQLAKFSTDYMPLVAGKNQIHIEFLNKNGKALEQDFTITKN